MLSESVTLCEDAGAGNQADKTFAGGKCSFIAEGTFGGGSVKLQLKTKQDTYVDVPSSTLSANGLLGLDLPAGTYRAVTATGSAFYAWLVRVPY